MEVIHRCATDRDPIYCSPFRVFSCAWQHRELIMRLARREVEARYRGSMLGIIWSLLVPLILLAVYTVVFSTIFKAQWALPITGQGQFALVLFSGMILFNMFAECCNRAPGLMFDNVNYIKKIVFPLEAIPWVTVAVSLFNCAVSLAAFLFAYLALIGLPPPSAILLPLMLLPLVLLSVGVLWLLSSLGVYLRDIQQFVPVFITVLMYINPIFYPRDRLPHSLSMLLQFSPLAVPVEGMRAAMFGGQLPGVRLLAFHILLTWGIAWLGLMWFLKTRKGFADVV